MVPGASDYYGSTSMGDIITPVDDAQCTCGMAESAHFPSVIHTLSRLHCAARRHIVTPHDKAWRLKSDKKRGYLLSVFQFQQLISRRR